MNRSGRLRLRNVVALLAVSLFGGAVVAPSATAVPELWHGKWDIHDSRTMTLHQDGENVHGHWEGAGNGKIDGTVSDGGQSWDGTYKDTDTGDHGKFHAKLTSDQDSFHGWFKSCGHFICGDKVKWSGNRL